MLNQSQLRSSLDKVVKRARSAAFVITFSTLSSLSSFAYRAEAIEPRTANDFKELARQAIELVEKSKVINPDGSVFYDVPESSKKRLEKEFDIIIKKLGKEIDEDLKNQDWVDAERLIEAFYYFLREMRYEDAAEELLKLRNRIHEDFVSHTDLSRPGIYTIRGSSKVYVIAEDSSRDYQFALDIADHNASFYLLRYLRVRTARIKYFGVQMATSIENKNGVYQAKVLVGFSEGGKVILDDGTELKERDIAERLEHDGRFLPLR